MSNLDENLQAAHVPEVCRETLIDLGFVLTACSNKSDIKYLREWKIEISMHEFPSPRDIPVNEQRVNGVIDIIHNGGLAKISPHPEQSSRRRQDASFHQEGRKTRIASI